MLLPSIALAFVLFTWIDSSLAAEGIPDPKAWAASIIDTIAHGNEPAAEDNIAANSGGTIKKENLATAMASIREIVEKSGKIVVTDLIAERRYGSSIVEYWYYLCFEKQDLYARLRLNKRGQYWQVGNVIFQTSFEQIGVPR